MVAENLTNFATTQLVGTTLLASGTTFTVTTNTGVNFPTSNFTVTIDAEILFVLSRNGDTFTIGTRGWDGSIVTSHSVGATILLCEIAYTVNHLWQNTADTYHPDVPPQQSQLSSVGVPNGTRSTFDTEFEHGTSWILYPGVPPTGTTFSVNTPMRSHLLLNRYAPNDNTLYTAYEPFTPGQAFTTTCRISDAINVPQNGNQTVETHFFVSDQSNPTGSADTGNRFRLDIVTSAQQMNVSLNNQVQQEILTTTRFVRCSIDINGTWYPQNPVLPVSYGLPLYLRINYDGNAMWNAYVGDGTTFTLLINRQNFAMNCQTLGFQFYAGYTSPYYVSHTVAIDFVRVVLGSQLPAYGV